MVAATDAEIKILEAAKTEFENKGYNGTRMQEIADLAGISKASLHYYFRSKDKLFEKIFENALQEFLPIVQTWSDETLMWEEKVNKYTEQLFQFIRKGSMLFIIREINRNPDLLTPHMKKKKKSNSLIAYFENLMQQNTIKKTDARLLYLFLNSLCCYPIVNREMFQKTLNMSHKEYDEFLHDYAKAAAGFFITAIKNK